MSVPAGPLDAPEDYTPHHLRDRWALFLGLGVAIASVAGALSLIVAHFLALDQQSGDTLEMLQAVLDTDFWLATHVTTVNLGYATTFTAGLFGIAYIVLGLFTRKLAGPLGKAEQPQQLSGA